MNSKPENDENYPYDNVDSTVKNSEIKLSDDEMNDIAAGTIPYIRPIVIYRGGEDMPPIHFPP
jgi:hypothetical protein